MSARTITLNGGKYSIENNNGLLSFKRRGEAWPAADDLQHAGVVLALVQRVEELEDRVGATPSQVHDDFLTHRQSWRAMLKRCVNTAQVALVEGETDDRAYYEHELAAFDRAYARLGGAK